MWRFVFKWEMLRTDLKLAVDVPDGYIFFLTFLPDAWMKKSVLAK